ncbi:MAG TPA: phosphoribosylanthranilate isomerase [Desulfatiglandales bacterium]|nr:phosphoribosylanthranilate isomerase [Desulfatiglandales bacterium]
MVKVKICGITNIEDATAAVELGVDMLGFIFASSPRQVEPEKARYIIHAISPFVKTVGVFVDEDPAAIKRLISFCGLDMVQLHGDESPEFCQGLMPRSIKSFRLKDETSLQTISFYSGKVRAFLFDTYSEKLKGGTGNTFDWNLAVKAKKLRVPIILSGGLNPSNIKEAISAVKPEAVDINSGVEKHPGKKDPAAIKKLMEAIRGTDSG